MKKTLSIITINKNNAEGLEKTITSVAAQTSDDFEYIIIDGSSVDNSISIINAKEPILFGKLKWISELDNGIYNAMNKGIKMATGDYIQILNSGDFLASEDVIEMMIEQLKVNNYPQILVGNMIKAMPDGSMLVDRGPKVSRPLTFLDFYSGTINHSPAYIKRELFEKFGFYDESLKIVSDWKWYTNVIAFGGVQPLFANIDVTVFDMTGISETNTALTRKEKREETKKMVPKCILDDYDRWSRATSMMERINRHPIASKLVWLIERFLFKIERIRNKQCYYR